MFYYPKVLLPLILSALSTSSSQALKCGQWNTHACLGDSDVRYDPDSTNDMGGQNELWDQQAGFYISTRETTQVMAHFNPRNLSGVVGIPYDDNAVITYTNITVAGSRRYEHTYNVYPPAPQEFCDLPVPPGAFNALNGGECGVNGYATFGERFFVSSYEKDGSINALGGSFGFAFNTSFDPLNGKAYPVDYRTLLFTSSNSRPDGGRGSGIGSFVFTTDDFMNARAVNELHNVNTGKLITSAKINYVRLPDEEAFVSGLKAAWDTNNVQEDSVSRGGAVPMQRECLGSVCATEKDWCRLDPNCSKSPYQEPPAKIKAGVVAGFIVAAAVVLLGIVIGLYNLRLKRQRERMRLHFATRIAETIKSPDLIMDPDALKEEFNLIDSGKEGGGDGYISKDELKDFMASGKMGTMDKKDFEMLYLAIDADGDGQVDYLEFCSFLKLCAGDIGQEETFNDNNEA